MPPLIIFKGQALQDWISESVGVPEATFAVTDCSMVHGPMFVTFSKKLYQWLRDDKIDGQPHVILLDDSASHMSLDVIEFTTASNLVIFHLPLHSSHGTQLLDILRFPDLQAQILQGWQRTHGNKVPMNSVMNKIIRLL